MTEPRTRKRLALFVFLLLVVGSLVVALWQYHQMVLSVYDGASASVYRRMIRPFSGPYETLGQRPVRVALMDAAGSDGAAESGEELIRQWKRFLNEQGFGVRRVGAPVSRTDLRGFNVVVVPGTAALSDAQLQLIKDFVADGNGVIMSWATGTRDHEGAWRDPWFLRHVAGIELDMSLAEEPAESRMTVMFDAQSPLVTGIEPGHILSLTRFDRPLTARIIESRARVAGGYVTQPPAAWAARAARRNSQPLSTRATIVHGDYLKGRFVWIGFSIASSTPAPDQQAVFRKVLRNAVLWATRQPMVEKPDWPEGVDSAFSVAWRIRRAEDVDDRLPALAHAYRIPLTSYVTPDFLRDHDDVTRHLAASGPVALWLADDDWAPAGDPPSLPALRAWRQQLAAYQGEAPAGCLIGAGAGDEWFERLVEAGFDYVTRMDAAHGLPRLLREYRRIPVLVRAHELWEMPDMPVEMVPGGSTALLPLFDAAHQAGGLLHLSLPAGRIDEAQLEALDDLFTRVRRRRVWVAHAPEILDYYRIWGHLRVSADYPTPNRYVVQVSNTGTRPARDFKALVHLASSHRNLEVTPTTLGTPPVFPVTEDGFTWRFDVSRIPPGKNFVYHLYRD